MRNFVHRAKRIILFFFFIFSSQLSFSQASFTLDSLENLLTTDVSDSIKFLSYTSLVNYYTYKNTEKAILLSNELLSFAKEKENVHYQATAYKAMGNQHYIQGNYANAIDNYLQAIQILEADHRENETADVLHNIASIQILWKNPDEALTYLYKAKKINEKTGNRTWFINNLQAIGLVYNDFLNHADSAIYYYKKSYKISAEIKYTTGQLGSLINIASSFQEAGLLDSVEAYLGQAIEIQNQSNNKVFEDVLYEMSGVIAMEKGEYALAERRFLKAIETFKKLNKRRELSDAYRKLATTYFRWGKSKMAYQYLELGTAMADSIFSTEQKQKIADLESSYTLLNKNKELELAQKDAIISKASLAQEATKKRLWLSIALGALAVLLLLFWAYRSNLKNLKTIAHKNEEITDINNSLSESNSLLNESVLEKNNILSIVAHDLRSPLAKIRALSDLLKLDGKDETKNTERLQKIDAMVEESSQLIGDLLEAQKQAHLHTQFKIESFDPSAEIENIVAHYSVNAKVKNIKISFAGESFTLQTDKYRLGRIADNLLSNAIKYSPKGKEIKISCAKEDRGLKLIIADQGPGFTAEDQTQMFGQFKSLSAKPVGNESSHGLGLAIVKRMTDELRGKLTLKSESGKGAVFTVVIPSVAS